MGGFDKYIQNTSARELGDEGMKWRIIIEQHIENGRKPIFPIETVLPTPTAPPPAATSGPILYSAVDTNVKVLEESNETLPALPATDPDYPETEVESSTTPSLLFARKVKKRPSSDLPRIPVFSRALQRSFIQQNITRSILAARGRVKQQSTLTI